MKKIHTILIGLCLLPLLFTSCFNAVFYEVMQDVPPEDATVSGVINSIARCKIGDTEYLFLSANGGIRYKDSSINEHSEWYTLSELPFSISKYEYYGSGFTGQQIVKVLSDSDTLYIVSVEYKHDSAEGTVAPNKYHLWALPFSSTTVSEGIVSATADAWTDVSDSLNDGNALLYFEKSGSLYYNYFNVFSTNAIQNSHRKAYIRSGDKDESTPYVYYELNGTSAPTVTTISSLVDFDPSEYTDADEQTEMINTTGANSAAYIGETLYFLNSSAVTTNETASTAATYLYYGDGDTLCYYDGTTITTALNSGENIVSLAVCSDVILIGRGDISASTSLGGGIVKADLVDGVPATSLGTFTTNAQSQLSTSYIIYTLLNTDTSLSETESSLYASIGFKGSGSSTSVSYDNIGLWSYYPDRGNWNRE